MEDFLSSSERIVYEKFWYAAHAGDYNVLDKYESEIIRGVYKRKILQDFGTLDPIFTSDICLGYECIVVGDAGAYVQFSDFHLNCKLATLKGQEWREEGEYTNTKYYWKYPIVNGVSNEEIKIYQQIKRVKYANYQLWKYYVNPYYLEVIK